MPYNDEQWKYFSDWKNYSKEKDIQYSEQEFNYFLQRLSSNEPFSLVRFGEGESRIILKEQNLNRSELSFDPLNESSKSYYYDLENCAKINHKNYFVGIQSYTFKPAELNRPESEFIIQRNCIVNLGNLPQKQYTCSRVFCNFYNRCCSELLQKLADRKIYFVCSEEAKPENLKIPIIKYWKITKKDAWKHDSNLYYEIQKELNDKKDCVLICCAGFFGNILISKMNHDDNYNINVGSVYDPIILGKTTRPYQRGKL